MVTWWVPAEDGQPGRLPMITELAPGTADECVDWACPVRLPWMIKRKVRLVIRAYTATAVVTAMLEDETE